MPHWGNESSVLVLTKGQYTDLIGKANALLRHLVQTERYDTFQNYILFYSKYKSSSKSLKEFYKNYNAPILPHQNTCVGLAMEAMKALKGLEKDFPGLSRSMMLTSCDEGVGDLRGYVSQGKGPEDFAEETEKDHVLLTLTVCIEGRKGVLLTDPGFHISELITVMQDREEPHTGWFNQTGDPSCRKKFKYQFNVDNFNYVEWHVRQTKCEDKLALVYVGKAYLDSVSVTEKRNLVWYKKSFVARNADGLAKAGIFFTLKPPDDSYFNLFYHNKRSQKVKVKIEWSKLDQSTTPPMSRNEIRNIRLCAEELGLRPRDLMAMLKKLAAMKADTAFITQVLEINESITQRVASKKFVRSAP